MTPPNIDDIVSIKKALSSAADNLLLPKPDIKTKLITMYKIPKKYIIVAI